MSTAILAFVFMVVIVGLMAIGVAFGRKPISGSCGGMKALGMDVECEICGGDPNQCETGRGGRGDNSRLAYDATNPDANAGEITKKESGKLTL